MLGLFGLLAVVAAIIPGVVNSSETGTAIGIGGGLCGAAVMPVLLGVILLILGRSKAGNEG